MRSSKVLPGDDLYDVIQNAADVISGRVSLAHAKGYTEGMLAVFDILLRKDSGVIPKEEMDKLKERGNFTTLDQVFKWAEEARDAIIAEGRRSGI